ncbi:MAG TPA: hypothetical protein VFF20_09840 [Pseudogracilibacillus sp.]|nr:hypothetical protein [Pseudogracilibacillus sp.]
MGWELYIYGYINDERKVEYIEADTEEVIVNLQEGEVVSLKYNVGLAVALGEKQLNLPIDDIKLIFEEVKN